MRALFRTCIILLVYAGMFGVEAAPEKSEISRSIGMGPVVDSASSGYRIDQPGTITFTVGLKIRGKVEKPQVMIFLPKERSYYRDLDFRHSFQTELSEPLPQVPLMR